MSYNNILSFGDFIPLKITCDVSKLFDEIKEYKYSKYNPRTDIERYGLSITSLDGELGGIDLDSFKQYNEDDSVEPDSSLLHIGGYAELQKFIK